MDGTFETIFANPKGHEKMLLIKGMSMYPFLRTGDLLFFEPIDLARTKSGDIMVVRPKGFENLVVHRLVRIRSEGGVKLFLTKGDNNLEYDSVLSASEIVGKGTKILRGFKEIDLSSSLHKFKVIFLLTLSKLNLNLSFLKKNLITRKLCDLKFFLRFLSLLYRGEVRIKSFKFPHGPEILKAFCGRKNFFHCALMPNDSELILTNWFFRFPFYKTYHGTIFLERLLEYSRKLKFLSIKFQSVMQDSPPYILFNDLGIKNNFSTEREELIVDLGEIESFFLQNQSVLNRKVDSF